METTLEIVLLSTLAVIGVLFLVALYKLLTED